MKPLRLRALNFRTFPELDLAFGDGLIGILGELRDAPAGADSNGAGKSSVLEAIDICLFGRRSLARFLTRGGDVDELMLELTFEHGHELYRVRRQFSARGRGKTTVDFERPVVRDFADEWPNNPSSWESLTLETTKQTDLAIIEAIGLTRATFRDSGYLRQGGGSYADPSRDPKERLELLVEAALGRDPVWPTVQEAAKAARREAQAQLERLAGETLAARELIATRPDVETAHAELLAAEQSATMALGLAERELQEILERYQAARDQAARRQVVEAELAALVETQERAVEEFSQATAAKHQLEDKTVELAEVTADANRAPELEGRVTELRAAAEVAQAAARDRQALLAAADQRNLARERLAQEASQLRDHIATLTAKAQHLDDHINEAAECDRCGQTLGAEAAARAAESYRAEAALAAHRAGLMAAGDAAELVAITELREQGAAIVIPETLEDPEPAERELRAARAAMVQRATLAEQVTVLQAKAARAPELEQASLTAAAAVTAKQELLATLEPVDLASIERAGAAARATVAIHRETLDAAKVERGRLDEKLAAITAAAATLTLAAATERDLQATIDVETLLEKACGRTGIPTLILEAVVIPAVEAKAAHILAELGTGYRVQLRTQTANKDGGLRDTCEAIVIDQTGEAAYDDFSGGEQTRIGLALQIALAEFIASRPGAESSFLALDEPSYLDASGMEALLNVLRDLLARRVFELVALVSHVPELRDSLDEMILIVKDGDQSRIEATEPEMVVAT
jgi:DNA repair exonuclease SbcCD ATPase subunit